MIIVSLEMPMDQQIKELSIIIPTLNEEHFLPLVLDHLAAQKWDGSLQVIVADGESTDRTVERARSYSSKFKDFAVVSSHNRTIGGARNLGAEKAKYRHLLFIDCDIFLPPTFLADFFKKIPSKEPVLAFVLHIPSKFNVIDYLWTAAVFAFYSIYRLFNPFCSGTFFFISRDVFDAAHGFKEGLRMAEDIDLSNRVIKAGAKFKFFYRPFVYASARRMHEVGHIKMLYFWMKGYFDSLRSADGTNKAAREYTFGTHKQEH